MANVEGSILTPQGWVKGVLNYGTTIESIEGEPLDAPLAPYIIPGFVDLHVHGGFGHDMMTGADAIEEAARFHAKHGTTSILATSVTAPFEEIARFLDGVRPLAEAEPKGRSRILGAHLEGPFVNPEKLGAQPPFAREAELDAMKDWLERASVRVVTLAPEMDPDGAVARYLMDNDVRVQIGHSLCDYAQACLAIKRGFGVTHLFNAMSGLAHRQNGAAGAALAHADYAEFIPDLIHVEAGAILAARRAIPNLYGVTDSTAGAGMDDGEFQLGAYRVYKSGDKITLEDGTLAGSVLTMDQALRNLTSIGLPLAEASMRLSTIPANWIGETKIGRLQTGAYADFVKLDDELRIDAVVIAGQLVD